MHQMAFFLEAPDLFGPSARSVEDLQSVSMVACADGVLMRGLGRPANNSDSEF
jgi:hypothetical protein